MDKITELTGTDLEYLASVLNTAVQNGERVRIHQTDDSRIKVARAGSIWTLPFGNDARS